MILFQILADESAALAVESAEEQQRDRPEPAAALARGALDYLRALEIITKLKRGVMQPRFINLKIDPTYAQEKQAD